jgi:hypothetical protein
VIYKQFIKDKHTRCKYCYSLLDIKISDDNMMFYSSFKNLLNSIDFKMNVNKNFRLNIRFSVTNYIIKIISRINNKKCTRIRINLKKHYKNLKQINTEYISIKTTCKKCNTVVEYLTFDSKTFHIIER